MRGSRGGQTRDEVFGNKQIHILKKIQKSAFDKRICFSFVERCDAANLISDRPSTDPEGGQGIRTPLKNHKYIGFLSNTGPDPLESHKATKPAFNVESSSARQRNAI